DRDAARPVARPRGPRGDLPHLLARAAQAPARAQHRRLDRAARHAHRRHDHRAVPRGVGLPQLPQAAQLDPDQRDHLFGQPHAGELPTRAVRHQLPHVVPQLGHRGALHHGDRHRDVGDRGLRAEPLQLPRQAGPDVGLPDHPDVPGGDPDRPHLHDHEPARAHRHQGVADHRLLHRGGAVLRLDAARLLRHHPQGARRGRGARRRRPVRHLLAGHPPARAARPRGHGVLHLPHRLGRGRLRHRLPADRGDAHPGRRAPAVRAAVQPPVGPADRRLDPHHAARRHRLLLHPEAPRRRPHRRRHQGL
ncbi:MAG: Maltodextrin ABC transporter, permease protein MdxG, partial [uncultured Nocardioides sp.]